MNPVPIPGLSDTEIFVAITRAVSGIEFTSFEIGITSTGTEAKSEAREKAISFVSGSLGKEHLHDSFDLYILLDIPNAFVEATPQNLYVEGRYNKLSRKIAQTFHYCFKCKGRGKDCSLCNGTGKLSEHSVQELLEKSFIPAFSAHSTKFHGCGREDVDVLMLGNGRPFVLEVVKPNKRSLNLLELEQAVNSSWQGLIQVHGLHFVGKRRVAEIKNAEFSKVYLARCECPAEITSMELAALADRQLVVTQRTPERVEKRRADKERAKTAEIKNTHKLSANEFSVEILASHGLYIKEFVSGDNGRTRPSISSLLGKECMCKELDVLEIIMGAQQSNQ